MFVVVAAVLAPSELNCTRQKRAATGWPPSATTRTGEPLRANANGFTVRKFLPSSETKISPVHSGMPLPPVIFTVRAANGF